MTQSPEFQVRLAHGDDVAAIEQCVHGAYTEYLDKMDTPPAPMLDDYGELVAAGRVSVATTVDAAGFDVVAGLIVGWPVDEHWYIDNIAVDPSHQGSGVGGRLLRHAEEVARSVGLGELRLYTNEVMKSNVRYYERRGFVITRRAIEHGYRRIWFSRRL